MRTETFMKYVYESLTPVNLRVCNEGEHHANMSM